MYWDVEYLSQEVLENIYTFAPSIMCLEVKPVQFVCHKSNRFDEKLNAICEIVMYYENW